MQNATCPKIQPSFLERLLSLLVQKPETTEDLTTRPEWNRGQRAKVERPFRRRAYHEAMAWNRPPVSYGPYHPYNLD